MKNMKTQRKSQIWAALSILLVAAVALTGATFAWFTTVSNPEVQNIDLTVRTANDMYISEIRNPIFDVGAHWKTTILKSEINLAQRLLAPRAENWGSEIVFPELKDVSSLFQNATTGINGNGFYKLRSDSETNRPIEFVSFPSTTDAPNIDSMDGGKGYAMFYLWFKSNNDGAVYINERSLVTAYKEMLDVNGYGEVLTDPNNTKHFVDAAVRVGFVPMSVTYGAGTGLTTPGTGLAEDWSKAIIWEPNTKKHLPREQGGWSPAAAFLGGGLKVPPRAVGATGAGTGTFDPTWTLEDIIGVSSSSPPTAIALTQPVRTFDFGATNAGDIVNSGSNPVASATNKIFLFNLKECKGNEDRVLLKVYIWVEGSDSDTVNAVAGSVFVSRLVFGQEVERTYTHQAP